MSWKKIAYLDEVAVLSDTAPVDVTVAVAEAGVATDAARQDHKHDISVKVNELDAPDGALAMNSQKITGLAAGVAEGDAVALDVNIRAPDSTLLEGDSKATVQDHTPKAHTLDSHTVPTSSIDINKQSLLNPVIDPQAAAPGTPSDGQIYYDTAEDHIFVYVA